METAPFYDEVAFGPDGGAAHWVTTADGLRIRVGHWPMDHAKGTVLMFPGRTEYIEKYGDAAREFQIRGYASLAIDWRGQGLSARVAKDARLGHVGTFLDYQKDVTAVMAHARALGLPEPFYLCGHSMGGCIGLRALHEGLPVKAAAFSAPMWGISIASWLRPIAFGAGAIARQIGRGETLAPGQTTETYVLREVFDLNTLTRDKAMWERLQTQMRAHPDLALGGPSLQWVYESMREMNALDAQKSPDMPCLTFLGSAESIVDPDRIKDRMARWPDSHLEMLQGAEHEVLLEIPATRQKVFDMMADHFGKHT